MDTSDFRNGLSIIQDADIYTIVAFQHVKPGKGGAFVRTTLKNIKNGRQIEKTFRAGERMEQAVLDRRALQYLYSDGDDYYVMDKDTFEQIPVKREQIGDGVKYLKENMDVVVMTHKDEIIGVEIPTFVRRHQARHCGNRRCRERPVFYQCR
jgi:elongation factor P